MQNEITLTANSKLSLSRLIPLEPRHLSLRERVKSRRGHAGQEQPNSKKQKFLSCFISKISEVFESTSLNSKVMNQVIPGFYLIKTDH